MISSKNNSKIEFDGQEVTLSEVRQKLKRELEQETLLGEDIFDVWINEDASPGGGDEDAWERCMREVKKADVLLSIYNGDSGWAKEDSEIGICHAELQTALSRAPAKVRVVRVKPFKSGTSEERDMRFKEYLDTQSPFWETIDGTADGVDAGSELIEVCKLAIRDAVGEMTRLGKREAKRGKYHSGEALDWSRMSLQDRKDTIQRTLMETLKGREGAKGLTEFGAETGAGKPVREDGVVIDHQRNLLVVCTAIPDKMYVTRAREMVSSTHLIDHEWAPFLQDTDAVGPVHFIAFHKTVTTTQAKTLLGYPDAAIVKTPFGIFVADSVRKVQLVLIKNCRDESSTRHGVQRAFEWLEQSGEDQQLIERASSRKHIISSVHNEAPPQS